MISKEFLAAGSAIFTASNPGNAHYTYRINKPEDKDMFFVLVLTGPDNLSDYQYLGVFEPEAGTVRLTRASKFTEDALSVKVLRWALDVVYGRKTLKDGYRIDHAGRCGRCGRTLTEPESIAAGLGPFCRGLMTGIAEAAETESRPEPRLF